MEQILNKLSEIELTAKRIMEDADSTKSALSAEMGISVPCFVMVFSNSLEVPPPADTNATSIPLEIVVVAELLHLHPLAAELIKICPRCAPNRTTATHPPEKFPVCQYPQELLPYGAARADNRYFHFRLCYNSFFPVHRTPPTLRRLRHPFAGLPGRAAQNGDIRPTPHQSKNSSSPE